ncbi:MAG: hypothetical protein ACK47M_15260, partial [Caldilinea sp.]
SASKPKSERAAFASARRSASVTLTPELAIGVTECDDAAGAADNSRSRRSNEIIIAALYGNGAV